MFSSWVKKMPWRRAAWLPTLVFLPGEFHGQRSLMGCILWDHKESDTRSDFLCPTTSLQCLQTPFSHISLLAVSQSDFFIHLQATALAFSHLPCDSPILRLAHLSGL